jgi:sugar O-acyltransferase (sialic acid O-acetyltransferase NeuD family)
MAASKGGVVVIGAGGHAKVVIATLLDAGYAVGLILDDNTARQGEKILDVPIDGPISKAKEGRNAVLAIGDNSVRRTLAESLKLQWISVVHPTAYVHPSVRIGHGVVVFAGALIQPDATVGDHVIVNTGASIDHDCSVDDYVHIAPGCKLAGNVKVGEGTFLGIGSSVIPNKRIGSWTTVGAGGVVVSDLPNRVIAVGVPARIKDS